jgi:prolyl-tRNA synthetase
LVDLLNRERPRADGRPWAASDTLKNVVVMLVNPDGRREPLVVGVPGDRQIDHKRLEAQVAPAEVAEFGDADFAAYPALVRGYIGPGALGRQRSTDADGVPNGVRYLLDPRVAPGSAWVTGANQQGRHVMNLVHGRDFTADGPIQAAEVRDGDPSPVGEGVLHAERGIEMGHIFQLGRKYADALGLRVLDENGRLVTVTMGSYGFGVSRAVAALAEANHDELGLVWPRAVAPADVHVVATGKDDQVFRFADQLVGELSAAGAQVLYDDRPKVSAGVKFKDAELIGAPTIVVVGKGLAAGTVEVKDRRSGARRDVPVAGAAAAILAELSGP